MSKISSPDYLQDVIDFIKKKGIDVRKERRGWIRFTRSGSLLYLTSSKEHTSIKLGNYGWYDLNKSIYDELVNESELKKYCAVLLGNPETIFVLSQLDIQKIFDEKFVNKPDEWMFNILKEGNDYVLKFIKNGSHSYPLLDFLNRWDKIDDFISNDQIITSETYHTKLVEENISTDTICKSLEDKIKPISNYWKLGRDTIETWTKALTPLRAKLSSESYEEWKNRLDIEVLGEIYQFITEKEFELKKNNLADIPPIQGLTQSASVIMCTIRQLQHQFLNSANMNAHKYNVLKNQFPKILKDNKKDNVYSGLLTFEDLKEFLSKKMIMKSNYQPIMIKTLLFNDGKASKEEIVSEIKKHNIKRIDDGYVNIPVFDVLQDKGVVKSIDNRTYILNSVVLNDDQKNNLISLCNKKIDDFEKISLWLIRAGGEGEGALTALDNNCIGIGYGGLPELHEIKDFEIFKETFKTTHSGDNIYRVGQVVPQIWNFMNEVKNGDFVILPLPPKTKLMAVGRVDGPYKIGNLHSEIQQYRPVYWLKKDVNSDEFDSAISRWFSVRGTVRYVGGMEVVNKLTDMLRRLGVSEVELEKTGKIDNILTSVTDHKNDYNLENKWLSLKDTDINDIIQNVLTTKNKKLLIDENVVKRIISHLVISKHVILVGPPGTGKTDLARRLLRELGSMIINNPDPEEAVASYEWGRYEVIGGRSIASNEGKSSFHFGCVTSAIHKKRFLLIDEFNRADMNKAFGEMFLALDHGEIQLREDEYIDDIGNNTKIQIPENFRMICTMNDYDKSLLNELSYGLLRRFAFVEINVPNDKQKVKNIVVERTYEKLKHLDPKFDNEKVQLCIDKFIDFLFSLKSKREIGLSSYIDVISYLMYSITVVKNDPGSALNESLVDYILPQFDRLDIETIRLAYENATKFFIFQDENGNTIESINPFLFNLKNRIQRLEDLDKLFKFGEAG